MSKAKTLVATILAATIAAGSSIPLSATASAHGWNNRSSGNSEYSPRVNRWGDVDRNPSNYEYRNEGNEGHEYRHRDHTGRNVALGVFATVLGLAIAAESNRVSHDYYGERD